MRTEERPLCFADTTQSGPFIRHDVPPTRRAGRVSRPYEESRTDLLLSDNERIVGYSVGAAHWAARPVGVKTDIVMLNSIETMHNRQRCCGPLQALSCGIMRSIKSCTVFFKNQLPFLPAARINK